MKKAVILIFVFILVCRPVYADPDISCKSAVLMEQSTGRVLYSLNPHEKLPPASVTKIMTMLLAMEEIDSGNLKLTDTVTASQHAKEMGGSTIYLDTGEVMTVDDIMKGIAVASGNDACVAIAEHIAGSEEDFVARMNARAEELGMHDTHFVNCNGLDAEGHVTSAYDIALMSRELLKHEGIFKYTTIWMDSLRGGAFTLSNTNKLIRFYSGANGLKTGSTSGAGCCISGTAKRDNMQLIASVMGSESSDKRFSSARALLDFGFANYALSDLSSLADLSGSVPVLRGTEKEAQPELSAPFVALTEKSKKNKITAETYLYGSVSAPVKKGDTLGTVKYSLDGEPLGSCNIVAKYDIPQKSFIMFYLETLSRWVKG
ncbi:MAG: D-alanyl-D-alanine carboxypeptidase [Clostridia bacterium]|nr:D-alanyl-D-alanine carboxypeptidase [Clostridia bacterium]